MVFLPGFTCFCPCPFGSFKLDNVLDVRLEKDLAIFRNIPSHKNLPPFVQSLLIFSSVPVSNNEPFWANFRLLPLTQGPAFNESNFGPVTMASNFSRLFQLHLFCFSFASLLLRFFLPFFCRRSVVFATLMLLFCTLSRWCYFLSLFSPVFLCFAYFLPSFCLLFPNARVRTMRTLRTMRTQVFAFSLVTTFRGVPLSHFVPLCPIYPKFY